MIKDQINNNDNLSKSIFDNLNTIIDINISTIYLDPKNFVNNFSGNIIYKKNKIYRLPQICNVNLNINLYFFPQKVGTQKK